MALKDYETPYKAKNKVFLKPQSVLNAPEDNDDELIGSETLNKEIQINKNFVCRICGGIPVAPVVQSKCCKELYCGDQCLKRLREQITAFDAKKDEEAKEKEEAAPDAIDSQRPVLCCKNKRCTKGEKMETEPISRIMRNIMNVFEFEDLADKEAEHIKYEKMIKSYTQKICDEARYSCLMCKAGLSEADKKGKQTATFTRTELEEHFQEHCPKFKLECQACNFYYQREDFQNPEKHNCVKNL